MTANASSGQTLTKEQTQALTLRGISLALSAGAGCGKTFILTERFLADLEQREDPQALFRRVAITFTERAAREMRDRIRKASLKRLSACEPDRIDYWQSLLQGLDTARISTIHAFCAALLRTHAVETRLDPHFGLLDQQTTGAFLYKSATHTVRSRLIAQDPLIMDLVLHYGLEKTTGILVSLVSQRYRGDWKTFQDLTPELLLESWIDHWHKVFVPELLTSFVQSPTVARVFKILQQHEPTHKVMQERCRWLLEQLPKLAEAEDPVTPLQQILETAKVQGGGLAKAWPDADIYEVVKNSMKFLRDEAIKIIETLVVDEDAMAKSARLSLAAVHVATEADRDYAAMKSQQALLDFDDLLIKTRDLLAEHPDVRRRLQHGIELLMVDEFQDTDPLQAEIVRLLCGDDLWDGKLFLVGDAKQSIYRFRRADPRVFHEFRMEMHPPGRLPLSTNFRSQPAILNFVNALFQPVMGADYEPLRPFSETQFSPPPCVEFLFAQPSDADANDHESQSDSDNGEATGDGQGDDKADQLREREADWIARRIRELLDDPTPRVRERDPVGGEMKLRPVQPGDIVLLFRGLTNVAVYEEALRRWGLDYYLVGGRAFYAQQEIYDIVNLLSYVDDADDFVSLVGALRSPFFSLTDDTLLALSQQPGGWETFVTQSVPEDLPDDQREQVQRAKDVFRQLSASKDRLSLVELMQAALELTGYDASLLHEFMGRRKLANLRKLVDLARSFDQAGVFTLKDFVQRLRTAVEDETDEEFAALHAEQTQIIRLMTIHQSKGLEFPVVFVAQMNWQPRGGRSQVYFHPEFGALLSRTTQIGELPKSIAQHMHAHHEQKEDASEVIRLLYVAMTRAADHLVLSAGFRQPPQWENKLSPWMSLLRERFDLSTGLPAGDPYLGQFLKGEATADDAPITTPAIPEIKVHLHAPEAKRPNERESTALRPSQFAEVAAQSEPAAFPALYGPVTVTANATGEYSVSAIETAYPLPLTEAASASNAKLFDEKTDGDESEPLLPATELGTAMHLALEWIDFECREPLAELVGRIFATQIPQPSAEIAHAVTRRLNVLHQSALWTELQQSRQCWRELDFLLTWPISKANDPAAADVIRGTIDCLYESAAGELIVRDYKTIPWNRPPDAAGLTHYAIQLGLYAFAVQQMFGRLPDRVELVFLGRRATQQSFTPTSGDLSHIARQVDAAITQLRAGSPAVLPK